MNKYVSIAYPDLEDYMKWCEKKAELKFTNPTNNLRVFSNQVYWAFLGDNVGSEEGKHRPVLVTRTYYNSPIVTIIPLTTQRLGDNRPYHIDLECMNSTALVEQMRIIDKRRIDKPLYINHHIVRITEKDLDEIYFFRSTW